MTELVENTELVQTELVEGQEIIQELYKDYPPEIVFLMGIDFIMASTFLPEEVKSSVAEQLQHFIERATLIEEEFNWAEEE